MTSLLIEHFDAPASTRDVRAMGAAEDRVGDVLAGRTVWCAMALAAASQAAQQLRARLEGAGPQVAAEPLFVDAGDQLRSVSERLDGMLVGARHPGAGVGSAEQELYADGARGGDELVPDSVVAEDVVVAHDALSALVARAARERGAHAVVRFRVAAGEGTSALRALDFLRSFTSGVDAYVLTWLERGPRGEAVERVAAAMPSAGIVAAKEFPLRLSGDQERRLAWRMALAEVVRSDRGECVGGRLHPRPTVAAR
jgi:hypothetical protein